MLRETGVQRDKKIQSISLYIKSTQHFADRRQKWSS